MTNGEVNDDRGAPIVRIDATLAQSTRPAPDELREDALNFDRLRWDVPAGWPPRLADAGELKAVPKLPTGVYFSPEDESICIRIARTHPKVDGLLTGRSDVLGCHLLPTPKWAQPLQEVVRVAFFNYTSGHLVDVVLVNRTVDSIDLREPWEHPESPREMAQAIAMVRNHPDHADAVADLYSNAILRVPLDDVPSYKHRCIHVMFTEASDPHRESPTLYAALVDLHLQRIIAAGPTPCADRARRTAENGESAYEGASDG